MGSTSETARLVLDRLLRGEPWLRADLRALIEAEDPALFSVIAEGLSDRFEPALAEVYGEMFAEVIATFRPEWKAEELVARHRRVRVARRFAGRPPRAVYVLSRVTLGADVAITSVLLDALKRRFRQARIKLVGGHKTCQLFAADPRIEHVPVLYGRGVRDRIGVWPGVWEDGAIVVDPDSRISQLGLVPVCPEGSYYFFDSRCYGGDGDESLGTLTRRWAFETFGVRDPEAYIAPAEQPSLTADVAVSFGVGENPAKRIEDPFEPGLISALARAGTVVIDAGAGGEEEERVRRAAAGTGAQIYRGSFAGFASLIARARLYVGYDSAGQHAAAACGVPLVSVFAGYPCERFCARWRPSGKGGMSVLSRDSGESAEQVLARTLATVQAAGCLGSR